MLFFAYLHTVKRLRITDCTILRESNYYSFKSDLERRGSAELEINSRFLAYMNLHHSPVATMSSKPVLQHHLDLKSR